MFRHAAFYFAALRLRGAAAPSIGGFLDRELGLRSALLPNALQ